MFGFEKIKWQALGIFSALTLIFGIQNYYSGLSTLPASNIYPMFPYYIAFSFLIVYIIIFKIQILEKFKNHFTHSVLAFINFLGNHTFNLYIYHWIVIDLTIWFINDKAILLVVPTFIAFYSIYHYKKIKDYYLEIKEI
jgi:peptidoglycan/LPS O-acetylase OafA/YrhL